MTTNEPGISKASYSSIACGSAHIKSREKAPIPAPNITRRPITSDLFLFRFWSSGCIRINVRNGEHRGSIVVRWLIELTGPLPLLSHCGCFFCKVGGIAIKDEWMLKFNKQVG